MSYNIGDYIRKEWTLASSINSNSEKGVRDYTIGKIIAILSDDAVKINVLYTNWSGDDTDVLLTDKQNDVFSIKRITKDELMVELL